MEFGIGRINIFEIIRFLLGCWLADMPEERMPPKYRETKQAAAAFLALYLGFGIAKVREPAFI